MFEVEAVPMMEGKQTYFGQYVSRRFRGQKMDTGSKQRLRALHGQLGTLLTQKKALNSKVTLKTYEQFREAVDAGNEPYEIKSKLLRLEQALKQEGLFKNVKTEFAHLKKEINQTLFSPDAPGQTSKPTLPGLAMPKDKTFYVAPKHQSDADQSPNPGSNPYSQKSGHTMSTDDLRILNSAIGKLFRHLQINNKDPDGGGGGKTTSDSHHKDDHSQKENMNILTLAHIQPEESFHELVLKIRNFEKEFQRQKVQQSRELMRLQEEIKRLNKNTNELRKENERMKGVQPIMSKAKGRQVEKMEERYRTEKKDMEEKLNELEYGMKKNIKQLQHDKEDLRHQFRKDVESVFSSINNVHHMVLGRSSAHHYSAATGTSGRTPHSTDSDSDPEKLPTKELLHMLTEIANGVHELKNKQHDLTSQSEDVSTWRRCMRDVDREITRFCKDFDGDKKHGFDDVRRDDNTDPHAMATHCKTKLAKTKENLNKQLQEFSQSESTVKLTKRSVGKYKRHLEELAGEVARLHEQVMSVQIQDISISMPAFLDARQDSMEGRSDGSTDELPEADRQEQRNLRDKLRQTGTMVTHFQQLIIDRTTILNKMENDMLPLKIRVNRLHEEISRAMGGGDSPDHDPADDLVRTKRGKSPDGPSNMFSKEISNMLTKLSKMELTIRHLLEQHGKSNGRASI